MRVRYEMIDNEMSAICDLSNIKSRKIFNDLKSNLKCKWAQLIDEDDNYMEVIDSFDHTEEANKLNELYTFIRRILA